MTDTSEKRHSTSRRVLFLATAATIVMIGTLVSRISGLVREQVLAYYFGAGMQVDAFRAGFILPNLFRIILAETAIGSAFIPIFTSYLAKKQERDAWEVARTSITMMGFILTTVVVFGIIFAPQLISVFTPGFVDKPVTFALAVKLTRIMFPCILFLALAGLHMGMLHSFDHFTAPAFAPLVFNLVFIGMVIGFAHKLDATALALGVTLGGIGQFLFQLPYMKKITGKWGCALSINLRHPGVKQVGLLLLPIIFTLASTDINIIVDMRFASVLKTGSVAALGYAHRLYLLPMGLFGFAVAAVLFPTLSRQAANGKTDELRKSFSLGTRILLFIMIPAGVGLAILSVPIVRILFQRGDFTAADTVMTASALFYYSASVFMMGQLQLVNRVYYALRDAITPLIIASALIVVNYFGDWAFMIYIPRLAEMIGLPDTISWLGYAHGGIALSTSIVTIIQVWLMMEMLRRRLKGIEGTRMKVTMLKTALASLILAATAFYSWKVLATVLGQTILAQIISLGVAITLGIAVYIGASFALKIEEMHLAKELILERFGKAKQ